MATCSSIINRALRKLGRLGAGRDARTNDAQDALDALRGLYTAWIASGAFGRLADVVVTGDTTAYEGQRIVRPIGVTAEITLPDFVPVCINPLPYNRERDVYDGVFEATDGNNRPPKDGGVIVIADQATGTIATWIYDGGVKIWRQVDTLALTDEAPMSTADPEGLAACLAIEVADQFGADPNPFTANAARRFYAAMLSRFSMPRAAPQGVFM